MTQNNTLSLTGLNLRVQNLRTALYPDKGRLGIKRRPADPDPFRM
jgi:hypothetical protein